MLTGPYAHLFGVILLLYTLIVFAMAWKASQPSGKNLPRTDWRYVAHN
jgi:hypothetical protein